jgi:hypothetical protein
MGSGTRKGASGQCDTPAPVADGAGDCTSDRGEGGLPPEIVQGFTRPFMRFVRIEAAAAVMLLLAAAAAMILSNSAWSSSFAAFWMTPLGVRAGSFEFTRSAHHWINDGLLTLFFFVIALELKREVVLGELRCMRTAALSIAGALGGMIGPACVYLVIMNGQPGTAGWGTVTATSTAFVIGSLALLGSRVPPSLRRRGRRRSSDLWTSRELDSARNSDAGLGCHRRNGAPGHQEYSRVLRARRSDLALCRCIGHPSNRDRCCAGLDDTGPRLGHGPSFARHSRSRALLSQGRALEW